MHLFLLSVYFPQKSQEARQAVPTPGSHQGGLTSLFLSRKRTRVNFPLSRSNLDLELENNIPFYLRPALFYHTQTEGKDGIYAWRGRNCGGTEWGIAIELGKKSICVGGLPDTGSQNLTWPGRAFTQEGGLA